MSRCRQIFDAAMRIENLADRAEFLNESCAADPEMRRRVQSLIDAFVESNGFMEHAAWKADWVEPDTRD